MGALDAIFNPNKNTNKGYNQARSDFNEIRSITDPFYKSGIASGTGALRRLSDLYGLNGAAAQQQYHDNFITSPAFQANFDAGTKAITNSAASRGMLNSGAIRKSLQQFGQGMYANEVNNEARGLAALLGYGNSGAAGLMNNSGQYGQYAIGRGSAKDAGGAARFGNIMNLAGTVAGASMGMPSFGGGSIMGQGSSGYNQFGVGRLF